MSGTVRLPAATLRRLVARHGTQLPVIDCAAIREQYRAFSAALPGVGRHYALTPLHFATVVAVSARARSRGAN